MPDFVECYGNIEKYGRGVLAFIKGVYDVICHPSGLMDCRVKRGNGILLGGDAVVFPGEVMDFAFRHFSLVEQKAYGAIRRHQVSGRVFFVNKNDFSVLPCL